MSIVITSEGMDVALGRMQDVLEALGGKGLTPAGNRDVTPPQKITEENVDEALKALLNA